MYSKHISEIKRIIEKNKIIWWVGAGISLDYPTCAPLAWDLMNSISKATKNWIYIYWRRNNHVREMINKNFNKWEKIITGQENKYFDDTKLSLEELLGLLEEEQVDTNQELLYLALDSLPFNKNHEFLARRIKKGDIVITTNFDSCIEKAFETLFKKEKILVAANKNSILKLFQNSKTSGLIKIHGSLRDTQKRKTEKTIQSTIKRILHNGRKGTFGLDEEIEKQLKALMRNRILIVVGYSGSDDLDINPSWYNMTSHLKKSYWFIYPTKLLTKSREEKKYISNKYENFFTINSNILITLTLREIGDYKISTSNVARKIQLTDKFSNWLFNKEFVSFAPLLFLASLLQECGLSRDAVNVLHKVYRKIKEANSITKSVYYKTFARIARDFGDYDLVKNSAQELIKTSMIARLPVEVATGFQLLADLELEKGNLINAIWFIECSIEYGEKFNTESDFALQHDYNLKAAILVEMGETEEAFEFYLKSLAFAQRNNDLESVYMAIENIKPLIKQSSYLQNKIKKLAPTTLKLIRKSKDEIMYLAKPIERYRLNSNKYLNTLEKNLLLDEETIQSFKRNKNINPNMIADRITNIANQYIKQSKYIWAKKYLFQALKIFKTRMTIGGLTRVYHLLAIIYYDIGIINKSKHYSSLALNYLDSYYPNKSLKGAVYQLLALIEMSNNKFIDALNIIEEAEELKKYVMEDEEVNLCKYTKIQILLGLGNYDEVTKLSKLLIKTYKQNENHLGLADMDFLTGLMYLRLNDDVKALHHFEGAQKIYKRYGTPLAYWRAKFNKAVALINLRLFKRALIVISELVEQFPEGLMKEEINELHYLIKKIPSNKTKEKLLNNLIKN